MRKPANFDERVDEAWKTHARHPEEYDGRLRDGRWFYFRYRWGYAYVGIGATYEEAVEDDANGHYYGGMHDSEWSDEHARNNAFSELLTAALATHRAH